MFWFQATTVDLPAINMTSGWFCIFQSTEFLFNRKLRVAFTLESMKLREIKYEYDFIMLFVVYQVSL